MYYYPIIEVFLLVQDGLYIKVTETGLLIELEGEIYREIGLNYQKKYVNEFFHLLKIFTNDLLQLNEKKG